MKKYAYAIFIISGYVATHAAWYLDGPFAALTVGAAILATVAGVVWATRDIEVERADRTRSGSKALQAGRG